MTDNRQSCDGRLVTPEQYQAGEDDNFVGPNPGDFYYLPYDPSKREEPTHIVIRRPDGFNGGAIPIKRGPTAPGNHWGWDGNYEKPTLTPSIWWKSTESDQRPGWHGHMIAGRLVSV